jgi:hypothetical protein
MLVSMGYHLCQTTTFCIFGMPLYKWQETDHITAGSILAFSILIFFLYRPVKRKRILFDDDDYKLGPKASLAYDPILRTKDRVKTCFEYRGVNSVMMYDWQSEFFILSYIYVIIIAITALPLTMQSFVIIISYGVLCALLKIVLFEEGDPPGLKDRFHLPSLITGLVLIAISLVFYFIDGYLLYWLFHPLWHIFSFVGFLFFLIGISKNLNGWFGFLSILKFLWKRTKNFLMICGCCTCCNYKKKVKYKDDRYTLPYRIQEIKKNVNVNKDNYNKEYFYG